MADRAAAGKEKDVVLITGGSDGGIGAALALEFARVGFKVVATSRNVSSMKELSTNENIHTWVMDVTDYEGAKAAVEGIIAEHGHIDILVNNAGVPCVAPVAEMPISFLEKTFQANVFGPVVLINAVVPHMVARGKGTIVNIGSIVSFCASPWGSGYSASKSALEHLTDALRLELKPFGIHAVLIKPGAISSNIGTASVSRIQADVLQHLKVYKDYEADLRERAVASQSGKNTPTDEFAKKVVAQVTAKSPPAHFVYGHLSLIFSILYYSPFWFRDWLLGKYYKLNTKRVTEVTATKDD